MSVLSLQAFKKKKNTQVTDEWTTLEALTVKIQRGEQFAQGHTAAKLPSQAYHPSEVHLLIQQIIADTRWVCC